MTTIHEYSHPLADTAEAFGAALDQHPEVIDRIQADIDRDYIEVPAQHAPGEVVKVPVFDVEDPERWDGCD